MLDFIKNYLSEIFVFISGFLTCGIAVKIHSKIKQRNVSNQHTGDNNANSGSVAAGILNSPVNIRNDNTKSHSPSIHVVGFAGEESCFINCRSTVTINSSSSEKRTKSPLSAQSRNLLKQFHESNGNLLLTFISGGIIEGVQTDTNQDIEVDDILAVGDDLDNLVTWGYLQRKQDTNAGRMYVMTSSGKLFALSLYSNREC